MHRQRNCDLFYQNDKGQEVGKEWNKNFENDIQNSKYCLSFFDLLQILFTFIVSLPKILFQAIKRLFKEPKSIKGKICLVTGAGRGLGRELSLELSRLGAEVICVDIREDINNETVKLIRESGGKAHGYTCNVAKYQEVADLAETVQKEVGRVYLLVNNAALIMTHKAGEWPPEDVIAMYNVNVLGSYWMIQSFLPAMKQANDGHIVNIISLSAMIDVPGLSVYGPTKAAIDGMIRVLRIELNYNKNNRIMVTGVYPSIIDTSNEIKNLYLKGNVRMLAIDETVNSIIEGIKYNSKFVIVPKQFSILALTARLFPEWLVLMICQILNICVNIPNELYKDKIPFNGIRQKCL
ncbi:hypothetical protein O3M35_000961 [Rhynocoris fuscipes]|uniref:Uncharacterized protein n=1 Tax=Rhynocoris fuscipes TaxID=488301 RepID=A0AAW1DQ81_9HEMI